VGREAPSPAWPMRELEIAAKKQAWLEMVGTSYMQTVSVALFLTTSRAGFWFSVIFRSPPTKIHHLPGTPIQRIARHWFSARRHRQLGKVMQMRQQHGEGRRNRRAQDVITQFVGPAFEIR
jgi:hypothetical protein